LKQLVSAVIYLYSQSGHQRDIKPFDWWPLTGGRNAAEVFEFFPIDKNNDE
jgi:hypothetical protein